MTDTSSSLSGGGAAVDADAFRQALGCFASGVTVVTARDPESGRPMGLTANAFSAVSLDPPLILVCVDRQARTAAAIAAGGAFAVHILAEDQAAIAEAFAGRADDKFAGLDWHWSDGGVPRLDRALVRLDCRRHDALDGGDHVIFVGHVDVADTAGTRGENAPLTYYRGRLGGLAPAAT